MADRLTDTLVCAGHLGAFASRRRSTKLLMSEMMPISSASGMNTAGEIGPISWWSQRHSASQLAMRIVSIATIGW